MTPILTLNRCAQGCHGPSVHLDFGRFGYCVTHCCGGPYVEADRPVERGDLSSRDLLRLQEVCARAVREGHMTADEADRFLDQFYGRRLAEAV